MAKVKQICEEKLRPVIEEMGYELVEVSYEKENGSMSLIFTIDKEEGVTIDDCETQFWMNLIRQTTSLIHWL